MNILTKFMRGSIGGVFAYSAFFLLIMLYGNGCSLLIGNGPFARDPEYEWGMHNTTNRVIRMDSIASYGWTNQNICAVSGAALPDGRRTEGPGLNPIPTKVDVHWVYEDDGISHDVKISVYDHIPDVQHFSGTLWFVFDDKGVHLEPETKVQAQARADKEAADDERLTKAAATSP